MSRLGTQLDGGWRRPKSRCCGVTLIEMLIVVALTVLLMSIIAEVFVLASETLSQLRSISDVNQKVRNVENVIRLDLENRTIREVQPPVERKAGFDGILGTADDYFVPIGFDRAQNMGYWMLEENSPADENGEDTDDVISFTVRLVARLRGSGTLGTGYVGRAVIGSEPDMAYPEVGLAGSQEAEIIYFLRRGTLYRRVLLVGVPQPSDTPAFNPQDPAFPGGPTSWYSQYDISARPPLLAGDIPIVNKLGDLTYRSTRFIHQTPELYADTVANRTTWNSYNPPLEGGLSCDLTIDPSFPFRPISFVDTQTSPALGAGWHDNRTAADADKEVDHNQNYPVAAGLTAIPELWHGRPRLRETSNRLWDYPNGNTPTALAFTNQPRFFDMDEDRNFNGVLDAGEDLNGNGVLDVPTRVAEDAIMINVYSFDVKVWDPDAVPSGSTLATGAYVDLGKMWPGASGSVTTPGPIPSNGTPAGLPGLLPVVPNGPMPGTWPPARRPGLVGPPLSPDHRGFAEPFGYDATTSPPYTIPPGLVPDMPLGMLRAPMSLCRTYDTWCSAYTKPTQVGVVPVAPPYMVPVRGIQIKIRFADPQTRLTREITIVQELQ